MRLEVIASSLEDAVEAEAGGADRIELVRDLAAGGLTPPLDLVDAVLSRVRIPIRVMVRHTISHVVSHDADRRQIVASGKALADRPVDGLVCGAVVDGRVDASLVRQILVASGGKRLTFHRAFESVRDPIAAVRDLNGLERVDRVLTNGGAGAWPERFARLLEWSDARPPHLQFILGGGVTIELLGTLPAIRGVTEIHVGRAVREPATDDGRVVAGKVEAVAAAVHAMPV